MILHICICQINIVSLQQNKRKGLSMKRIANVLIVVFCLTSTLCYAEDSITCESYPDFHPSIFFLHDSLVYYISGTQEYIGPAADSVWIENENGETVMVVHALPGQKVDISSLKKGYYVFKIQIEECIMGRVFYKRNDPPLTALDDIPAPSSATKILRDGQLYILREGKTYTVTGQEVK